MIQGVAVMSRVSQIGLYILQRAGISSSMKRGIHFTCRKLSEGLEITSALYVSSSKGISVNGIVSPYIDLSNYFENVSALEDNLRYRGLDADIRSIVRKWTEWKELEQQRSRLEEEKAKIAKKNRNLKRVIDSQKGIKIREELRDLHGRISCVKDDVIIPALQLPNILHHSTSCVDKLLFSMLEKPSFCFPAKGHQELGKRSGELEFVDNSPTAFYLKKDLALLELACGDYFMSALKNQGYLQQCNTSLAKAVVVEGCGVHYLDRHKLNKLSSHRGDLNENSQHLVGGGSLPAFVAYVAKQIIDKPDHLPLKLVTVARNYRSTDSEYLGLFGCRQSTVTDGFLVHESDNECETQLLDELLITMIKSYAKLGLHFKVIQYSAPELNTHESAAIGLQMFSPSTGKYHEVGRISVCGDYISKRLWTLCRCDSKSCSFLSVIHVRMCHITRLIGLLIENQQQEDGTYIIPDGLQSIVN